MTDDLVEHLRANASWGDDRFAEAADRIEALTAERDRAYAIGYSDAETEISTSALGQKNAFLHSQYANAADRIKVLTAERDALAHVIDNKESHYGISSNGGMWRFWADEARKVADENKALTAECDSKGKDYNALKVWYRQVRQSNAKLRAVLDLDPWFVGREAWKKYTDIALKEDNHE